MTTPAKSRKVLGLPNGVEPADVKNQLQRILQSDSFQRSPQLSDFLRFAVEKGLSAEQHLLKETTIALEVFGRPVDFDPKVDPIVRVEAGRLRNKVREFYETTGCRDRLWVGLASRGYRPVVRMNGNEEESVPGRQHFREGPSLAVLPIEALSFETDLTPISKALTAQLIHGLAVDGAWEVAARTTIRKFRDDPVSAREIGDQVNVESLLEGSLQIVENNLRLQLRLVNVKSGLATWAATFEEPTDPMAEAQESLVRKAVEALRAAAKPS